MTIRHPRGARGQLLVRLFRPDSDTPRPAWRTAVVPRGTKGTATWSTTLPPGRYGFMVAHDENANGTIDHRFLLSVEDLAFSGGFELTLLSGKPSFEKLAETVPEHGALLVTLVWGP